MKSAYDESEIEALHSTEQNNKGPAGHVIQFFHFVCGNQLPKGNLHKLKLQCDTATLVHDGKTELQVSPRPPSDLRTELLTSARVDQCIPFSQKDTSRL